MEVSLIEEHDEQNKINVTLDKCIEKNEIDIWQYSLPHTTSQDPGVCWNLLVGSCTACMIIILILSTLYIPEVCLQLTCIVLAVWSLHLQHHFLESFYPIYRKQNIPVWTVKMCIKLSQHNRAIIINSQELIEMLYIHRAGNMEETFFFSFLIWWFGEFSQVWQKKHLPTKNNAHTLSIQVIKIQLNLHQYNWEPFCQIYCLPKLLAIRVSQKN